MSCKDEELISDEGLKGDTYIVANRLSYLSVLSHVWVVPSLSVLCGYQKFQQPLFAIILSALLSLYFDLSVCLVGSRNEKARKA